MITRSIFFALLASCPTSALAQYWQAPTYYYPTAYYSWPAYDNYFDCSTECSSNCVADDCELTNYKFVPNSACTPCKLDGMQTTSDQSYTGNPGGNPAGASLNQFHAFSRGDEIFAVNTRTGWLFRYDIDSQEWKGVKAIPTGTMPEEDIPKDDTPVKIAPEDQTQ